MTFEQAMASAIIHLRQARAMVLLAEPDPERYLALHRELAGELAALTTDYARTRKDKA